MAESFGALLEFKVAKILQDDSWHRHAQSCGKILNRHGLLLLLIQKEIDQAVREVLRVSRLVELNRQLFPVSHLAKIGKIRADDGYAVGAC